MRHRLVLCAAATALILFTGSACGGADEKSEAEIRDDLSASLQQSGTDLDDETADCYADAIIDELGIEAIREVDLADSAPDGALDDDIAAAALNANEACTIAASGS